MPRLLKRMNAKAQKLAEETGSDFFVLECILDEDNTRQRLAQRLKNGSVSDGRWEIYEPQKKKFDPVTEVAPDSILLSIAPDR